jgi:hypothetical protein
MLLDDVPFLSGLDPTEGNGSGGNLMLILLVVLALAIAWKAAG